MVWSTIREPLLDLGRSFAPGGMWVGGILLVLVVGYRLLAERARRKTLIDICQTAPEGTEVTQEGWAGGPAMHLKIGDRPDQAPQESGAKSKVGDTQTFGGDV